MRAWLLVWLMSFDALAACPPDGWTRDALQRLKAEGFAVAEDSRRAALARGLAACLADPDPAVRDGIAFEAYAHWLRSDRLDEATRRDLLQSLTGDDQAQALLPPLRGALKTLP